MNHSSSPMNQIEVANVDYRRNRVVELYSEGRSQRDIAQVMKISQPTINRDLQYQRRESRKRIKTYLDEYLPFEHNVCQIGINRNLRKTWDIINSADSYSEKALFQPLSLAKDCYSMKHGLLCDETIIEKTIEFVRMHNETGRLAEDQNSSLHPRFYTDNYALSNAKF